MLSSDVKKAITTDMPSTGTTEKGQNSEKNNTDTSPTETKKEGIAKEVIKI